jgi:serine/threonine protein kinase
MVANNAVGDEVLKPVRDSCANLPADDSLPKRAAVPQPVADASEELPPTRELGPPARGRPSLPDPDPWVDEYELLECIGRGGMGVVYKARQLGLNRIVALKAILAGQDAAPDQLARFRREGETLARLRHPNIVPVYSVGERDGCPFFSMECVEGRNLAQRIAGKPQPERQAARWVEIVARAVSYADREHPSVATRHLCRCPGTHQLCRLRRRGRLRRFCPLESAHRRIYGSEIGDLKPGQQPGRRVTGWEIDELAAELVGVL